MAGPFASAQQQTVALKTNLLYDALLNANLGLEIGRELKPRYIRQL